MKTYPIPNRLWLKAAPWLLVALLLPAVSDAQVQARATQGYDMNRHAQEMQEIERQREMQKQTREMQRQTQIMEQQRREQAYQNQEARKRCLLAGGGYRCY